MSPAILTEEVPLRAASILANTGKLVQNWVDLSMAALLGKALALKLQRAMPFTILTSGQTGTSRTHNALTKRE